MLLTPLSLLFFFPPSLLTPLLNLLPEPPAPPKKINPDTHTHTPRYYTRCTHIQNQAQTHLQPAAQHLILMLGEEGALQPFLLFIFLVVLLLYFFCPTIHFLISFPLQSFSPSFNACPESRCEMLGVLGRAGKVFSFQPLVPSPGLVALAL